MNISSNITSMITNQTNLNTTANNIANVNTDGYIPKNNSFETTRATENIAHSRSQTNLTKEIPDLMIEEITNAVNVSAIKTQNEMLGTLIDIKV